MALPVLEAASLVLDALGRVGEDRAGLTAAMRGTRDRDSVIGRYSFDAHGATTLRSVGRLRVENRRFVPV
jgi:branched-chain amino acid transport system substrate-binding protein